MSANRLLTQSLVLPLMASFTAVPYSSVTASVNPAFLPSNSFHPHSINFKPNSSVGALGRRPRRKINKSKAHHSNPTLLPFHASRAGITTRNYYSPFSELDTAFEWLARERVEKEEFITSSSVHGNDGVDDDATGKRGENRNGGAKRQEIQWFSPSELHNGKGNDENVSDWKTMPLYPLGEVHVPFSGENHTLINTEPRNVKMARVSADDGIHQPAILLHAKERQTTAS